MGFGDKIIDLFMPTKKERKQKKQGKEDRDPKPENEKIKNIIS